MSMQIHQLSWEKLFLFCPWSLVFNKIKLRNFVFFSQAFSLAKLKKLCLVNFLTTTLLSQLVLKQQLQVSQH